MRITGADDRRHGRGQLHDLAGLVADVAFRLAAVVPQGVFAHFPPGGEGDR